MVEIADMRLIFKVSYLDLSPSISLNPYLAYLARSPTLCFQSKIIKQVWDESPVTCYNGQQGGAGRVPHY
ncbi:hypothetical protein, partial [Crocosphaera sp.]|uniref:hypothetical protein n=1 Tax=Crocosphaera sp. TaxID=2729996 RepID=UPI003F22A473